MNIDRMHNYWPEWTIVRRIGRGSYGSVYEAVRKDHLVESHSAIKAISIPQDESELESLRMDGLSAEETRTYLEGIVQDFVSEIRLMESFKGVQNIVSVEDYLVLEKEDEIGWDIFIRMELLTPFNTYIYDRTLSEQDVIQLGVDICTALELCAKRNVIHRDIKPENIFVNQFGDYKLGDFGIARKLETMTKTLSKKYTPNYMAPEIEKSATYDARVDIYSLGLVLYRLLNNNRLPFLDTQKQLLSPAERETAIRRRLNGEPLPKPCNASPAMANVILCACEPDPARRFKSASALKKALLSIRQSKASGSGAAEDRTVSVRHAAPPKEMSPGPGNVSYNSSPVQDHDYRDVDTFGQKKKSRVPIFIAIAAAAVVVVVGLVFFFNNSGGKNNSDTKTAKAVSEETVEDGNESKYSDYDEEQIDKILNEAADFASDEDYESALAKIKAALITYPKSEELKEKETEYTDLLTDKAETLAKEEAERIKTEAEEKAKEEAEKYVAEAEAKAKEEAEKAAEEAEKKAKEEAEKAAAEAEKKAKEEAEKAAAEAEKKAKEEAEKAAAEAAAKAQEEAERAAAEAAAAAAEQAAQEAATTQGPVAVFHPSRSDGINLRAQPDHNSDLVAGYYDNSVTLYYYGETGQGYGSDGELHTWYYVVTDSGIAGWVRSDLVV